MTELVFDRLSRHDEAVVSVTQGVEERLVGYKDHLASLASTLLGLAEVRKFVWNWWGFLRHIAMENCVLPPTSTRAAKYTKARKQMREEGRYDGGIFFLILSSCSFASIFFD